MTTKINTFLGAFSFVVLVDEVVFSYMVLSPIVCCGIFVLWEIKKIKDFNTSTILVVENNNQSEVAKIKDQVKITISSLWERMLI